MFCNFEEGQHIIDYRRRMDKNKMKLMYTHKLFRFTNEGNTLRTG